MEASILPMEKNEAQRTDLAGIIIGKSVCQVGHGKKGSIFGT
jgi:hypothetical protein